MADDIPPKPTGNSPQIRLMRALWEFAWGSGRMIAGRGVTIDNTTKGRVVNATARPSGGGGSASLGLYTLVSVQGDSVTATDAGGAQAIIMKEWKVRNSLTSEPIFGSVHNYTYAAGPDALNIQRTDAGEVQRVVPPWVVGEKFYALPGPDGKLVMLGRSAQWSLITS